MITEIEVLQFVRIWFDKLNKHVESSMLSNMVIDNGLLMKFPDTNITNKQEFITWYKKVCGLFFNEQHIIRNVQILSKSDTSVTIAVYVNWIAQTWKAPDAYSNVLDFDAFQTWVIQKVDNEMAISKYIVEDLIENTK